MKKATNQSEAKKVFGRIQHKIDNIVREVNRINEEGIPRNSSAMIKDPSPMYQNEELARRVLENPDIEIALEYVKDKIEKVVRE